MEGRIVKGKEERGEGKGVLCLDRPSGRIGTGWGKESETGSCQSRFECFHFVTMSGVLVRGLGGREVTWCPRVTVMARTTGDWSEVRSREDFRGVEKWGLWGRGKFMGTRRRSQIRKRTVPPSSSEYL